MTSTSHSTKNKKIMLFPGEEYNFNRLLLPYNIFSFNSSKLYSKKFSMLNLSSTINPESILYYGKHYTPTIDDVIIGVITQKSYDNYKLDINTSQEAVLGLTEFEGATRKTKPNLQVGDIVFAKVILDNKFHNTVLTCKCEENIKNWSSGESTFGQLNGGNMYSLDRIKCIKLINNNKIIKRIQDYIDVEVCIGMNGRIWISTVEDVNNMKVFDVISRSFNEDEESIEKYINVIFNLDNKK